MPDINEQQTRVQLIDKALTLTQWSVAERNQVGLEISVAAHLFDTLLHCAFSGAL